MFVAKNDKFAHSFWSGMFLEIKYHRPTSIRELFKICLTYFCGKLNKI